MAIMQVYDTGICVAMSQNLWDILSKRIQKYDEMTEHIMGPQEENAWSKTFMLAPGHKDENAMVPFLCDMGSIKVLGTFLEPNECFSIQHCKRIPVISEGYIDGPELQEYLCKLPIGWC